MFKNNWFSKKNIFFTIFLLFFFFGYAHASTLFNYESETIQKRLEQLNDEYRMNLNIVILENENHECFNTNISSYITCVESKYPKSALTFVIHWGIGQMQTIGQAELVGFMDGTVVKDFEVEIKSGLRSNGNEWGINKYIDLLEEYIKKECSTYNSSICQIQDIIKAKNDYKIKEAEKQRELDIIASQKRAENMKKVRENIKNILFYFFIASIIGFVFYSIYLLIRNNNAKKRASGFYNDLILIKKSIEFNNNIFEDNRKELLSKVKEQKDILEELLSKKNSEIYKRMKIKDFEKGNIDLKRSLHDILKTISKTTDLEKEINNIKNIDL